MYICVYTFIALERIPIPVFNNVSGIKLSTVWNEVQLYNLYRPVLFTAKIPFFQRYLVLFTVFESKKSWNYFNLPEITHEYFKFYREAVRNFMTSYSC